MIVKVQRPLFPTNGCWLLYNREQTMHIMLDESEVPKYIKQEMIGTPKAYFEIDLMLMNRRGEVIKRIEDQDW